MHKGLLHTAHENVSEEELEGHVDWRTEGAVSDVKDQGTFLFIFIKNTQFLRNCFLISIRLNSVENSPSWVCLNFFRPKYILRKT